MLLKGGSPTDHAFSCIPQEPPSMYGVAAQAYEKESSGGVLCLLLASRGVSLLPYYRLYMHIKDAVWPSSTILGMNEVRLYSTSMCKTEYGITSFLRGEEEILQHTIIEETRLCIYSDGARK